MCLKTQQRAAPRVSRGSWARGALWTGALASCKPPLLGHPQCFLSLRLFMCPQICAPQLLIPHLFITGPEKKSAPQRAESGKVPVFMLYQWKCLSHLNNVVIWLRFSFMDETPSLFKLTYNRSHKCYPGDSKPSFYVKLLFVGEKDFIVLSWSYFVCKRSHRQ